MTQDVKDQSKGPRDFVGLVATVEDVKLKTKDSDSTRIMVGLSFPLNTDLLAELAKMHKLRVFVGFGFMQEALPFVDDPSAGTGLGNTSKLRKVGDDSGIADSAGELIIVHGFVPSSVQPVYCSLCGLPKRYATHPSD